MINYLRKQLLTVKLLVIACVILCHGSSYAVCNFTVQNGGQMFALPGQGTGGYVANLWGCASALYTIQVSHISGFNLDNMQVAVNGTIVGNPSVVFISNGNNQIYVTGIIPNGTACGQTCTVNLWLGSSGGGTAANSNYYFKTPTTPSLYISGSLVTCNTSPQTYTIGVPGGCTNCTYTWNSLDPSWQINGLATWPTNTSSASASINPTVVGSSTNLNVSVAGSNICGSPSYTLEDLNSYTPSLTLTPTSTCSGSGGTVTINATSISGATYAWQSKPSTSSTWTTMAGATSSSISPSVVTTSTADVLKDYRSKATTNSGCVGPWSASVRIRWCKNNGVYCCIVKREGNVKQEDAESVLNVYPNPNAGTFKVALNRFAPVINRIVIKDVSGRVIKDLLISDNKHETDISLVDNGSGIYLLEVTDADKVMHQSKIVVQN